jgi:hypothetical protein
VAEGVKESWKATKAGVAQSEEILDYINEVTAEVDFKEYQPIYEQLIQQVAGSREAYVKLVGEQTAPTAKAAEAKFAEDFAVIVEDGTAGWLKEQMEAERPLGLYMFENRALTGEERKQRNAAINPNNYFEWEDRDKYWTDEQLSTVDGTDSSFGFAIVMDEYSLPAARADVNQAKFNELHARYPSIVIPKDNISLARNKALVNEGRVDLGGSDNNFDLTYTEYVDLPAVDSSVPNSFVDVVGGANLAWSGVGRESPVRLAVVRQV